jgi:hypothetical protein
MTRSEDPDALRLFRRTAWKYQQTFRTPLKNLQPFAATILSAIEPFREGILTIDQVVFEPRQLVRFLSSHSLPTDYARGSCLKVDNQMEA